MGYKVLMIDDDEEYVTAITCFLETHGYSVVSAFNGKDGMTLAQSEHPDIILLDNMMTTDLEGIELARTLHAETKLKDIPVIMITGMRKAMNLPFEVKPVDNWLPVKAVLEKPVKLDDLLQTIEANL